MVQEQHNSELEHTGHQKADIYSLFFILPEMSHNNNRDVHFQYVSGT